MYVKDVQYTWLIFFFRLRFSPQVSCLKTELKKIPKQNCFQITAYAMHQVFELRKGTNITIFSTKERTT